MLENKITDTTQLSHFLRLLYGQSKTENRPIQELWKEFLSHVNESAFAIADWTEALLRLQENLTRPVPWARSLGYIHCCAEAAGMSDAPLGKSLAATTLDFYQKYGLTE